MTFENIKDDLKTFMKERNNDAVNAIKAIISEVKNQNLLRGKEITEDLVIDVVKKLVKQHKDSIEQFEKSNRNDLVEKESNELVYLEKYIPKMYSLDETKVIVDSIIKENKLEFSKKSFGLIMKNLKTRNDKNMFDMQTVSGYLNSILK